MDKLRFLLVVAVSLALFTARSANAAPFVVNTAGDAAGTCPGTCTLRAAIDAANASVGLDSITFAPGADNIVLAGTELEIDDDLEITGPVGGVAIVDGGLLSRVFCVGCGVGAAPTVAMTRVTIHRGISTSEGGGIFNGATLTLTDSSVNDSSGTLGGGIYNAPGAVLTLHGSDPGCEVVANRASDAGGGLRNEGTATLTNARILDNVAFRDGGGIANVGTLAMTGGSIQGNQAIPGDGGGLSNELIPNDRTGTATLTNVFMKANYAETRGGGILNEGTLSVSSCAIKLNTALAPGGAVNNTGTVTIVNTSISTNTSAMAGGGIASTGTATLNSVTIAFNGSPDHGGGVDQSAGVLSLSNTLVGGNTAPHARDCSGTLTSNGYNLFQEPAGCTITGDTTGNILGGDPRLSPAGAPSGLAVTPDHALLAGSAAINAGNPATPGGGGNACLDVDQQGFSRVGRCDIGAFESRCGNGVTDPSPPDRTGEVCDDGNQDETCCTATCTLSPACGGTTTTTLPPLCTTFTDCTDDDRCTLKSCENGRCVSDLRPGYEGVDCRLGELLDSGVCAPDTVATRLSKRIQKTVARIRNMLEASAAASTPKKSRKILTRATREVESLRRQVLKSSATPTACREHLLDLLEQRRRLIQDVS